mmetsp:Transcript_5690/g.13178  ORF Transcript_5690/g.13178 Transcript_5690/m.13178 type:complete len:398 (-) Transcript_5690:344-1537(-)
MHCHSWLPQSRAIINHSKARSVDPLLKHRRLFGTDLRVNLVGGHGGVLREVNHVLPREELEVALGEWLATKVAVRSGHIVLGLAQTEVAGESAWTRVEIDLHNVCDALCSEAALLGAVRLDEERERLRHADRIRELHESPLAEAGLDNRLGHPAARIRRRTVDLRRVFAREGAAAMRSPTAVRIDNDLAAGQACVALWATDDELSRRINVQVARVAAVDRESRRSALELDLLERCDNHFVVDQLIHRLHRGRNHLLARVLFPHVLAVLLDRALRLERLCVLGGDDDRVDHQRLDRAVGVLLVLDGHLRLAIRAEPPQRAVLAHVCELLAELRRHQVRQRHARLGLVRGVPEHDALVAGADVEVRLAHVHAASNVRRLLVDAHKHLTCLAGEALRVDR